MSNKTLSQYNSAVEGCRDIFIKKTKDYGTSWRMLRPKSLTDQLFIKAQRIRTIEEAGEQKVNESIDGEFMALVNYCVMGLIQLELGANENVDIPLDKAVELYDKHLGETRDLMLAKNHDYGEAWRDMRISSYTDLILMKILRIKQIEENQGQTIISEGIDSNYRDILNYAVFALIKLTAQDEVTG